MRMLADNLPEPTVPNRSLLRLLARAHELHVRLTAEPRLTIAQLADQETLSPTYIYRLLCLRWLAPDIVDAILDAKQPAKLNATAMMHQNVMLPAAWTEQRQHLGFS